MILVSTAFVRLAFTLSFPMFLATLVASIASFLPIRAASLIVLLRLLVVFPWDLLSLRYGWAEIRRLWLVGQVGGRA